MSTPTERVENAIDALIALQPEDVDQAVRLTYDRLIAQFKRLAPTADTARWGLAGG